MKIALFRDIQFGQNVVFDHQPLIEGYVQTSGWMEVEFPPLTEADQRISDELQALAKRQKSFEEDFRRQRKALEDERAALLKTGT